MAKKPSFGGLQGSNWKHSGMTQKRYDALDKAHKAAAALRRGSGKGKSSFVSVNTRAQMPRLKVSPELRKLSANYRALSKQRDAARKAGSGSKAVRNITKRMNRVVANMNKLKQ